MKRRDFLQNALVLGSGGASALALTARAQNEARELRLVFSRGGDLFVAPVPTDSDPGRVLAGISDARRVLTVGMGALWAVSPDGRRVVWMPNTDSAKPNAAVFLSDLIGRHQKKLLTLGALRDRQGNAIKKAGVDGAEDLSNWQPVSLGWSADGHTVYVGFSSGDAAKRATFAADAINGTALIDGDGRWKLIAPLTHIDAQGGLLIGIDAASADPATSRRGGLIAIVNTTESGIRTILGSRGTKTADGTFTFKPYDQAVSVALAPDHRSLAYVSALDNGLWLRDRWAKPETVPFKLCETATGIPRWAESGKSVLFLFPNPDAPNAPADLVEVDAAPVSPGVAALPRVLLKNVDAFALVPL